MKDSEYDILVVGAGPAGSSAAFVAAKKGVKVLLVDSRSEPGLPVRCAEYVPAQLLGKVGADRSFLVQPVKGMMTLISGRESKYTAASGFMIDRGIFDRSLAEAAVNEGAEILSGTRALSLEDGIVLLKGPGGRLSKVRAGIIIGADGPHSTVGRWIDSTNSNLIPGLQYRVPLKRPLDHTRVYLEKYIYAGYGWLFPRGQVANVGLGMKKSGQRPGEIRLALERFLAMLAEKDLVEPVKLGTVAGWIPAESGRRICRGKILLAGDAAGHTHPITGAGIANAVLGGRMAGKWAAKAAIRKDEKILQGYEREWNDTFKESLERASSKRMLMEERWDLFEEIIKGCWVAFRQYYE